MTIREQNKFIERQRGRMRRLKKSGVYSPALAQLERRAEQAGINPFSKSSKMSPEDREKQLNLLWQFSRAKTSTLEGAKEQQVLNKLAVRKAKGKTTQEEIEKVTAMTPKQQWKWYTSQKDQFNEDKFIGDLWEVLKHDYQNFKYSEGGNASVTNQDIKDLVNEAEYLGATKSLDIINTLKDYLNSTASPELVEIKDILEGNYETS